jgi:hypothetical protein
MKTMVAFFLSFTVFSVALIAGASAPDQGSLQERVLHFHCSRCSRAGQTTDNPRAVRCASNRPDAQSVWPARDGCCP